jgi:hypothetical protein
MTPHHVFPRRHRSRFTELGININRELFWLCRRCHNVLELFIPREFVEDIEFYRKVVQYFMSDPTVILVYSENPKRFVHRLRLQQKTGAAA